MKVFLLILMVANSFAGFSQPSFIWTKENIGSSINDENDQLVPQFDFSKNQLFFSQNSGSNHYYVIYKSAFKNGIFGQKEKSIELNSNLQLHQYVFGIFEENLYLINGVFSGSSVKRGFSWYKAIKDSVFSAQRTKPLKVDGLDTMMKGEFANVIYHPKRKILILSFATSKKRRDLYICTPKLGQNEPYVNWNKPIFIESLNTEFEETCPFLDEDGTTLFFASNRPGGYGGDDIYRSQLLNENNLEWSVPVNLGFYVNSNKSELYYSISQKDSTAYFVSYKNSFGAGDLFKIQFTMKKYRVPKVNKTNESTIAEIPDNVNVATVKKDTLAQELNKPKTPIVQSANLLSTDFFAPNNIYFLLDISKSMNNDGKMEKLREAADALLSKLRTVDKVSLMTFGLKPSLIYSTQSFRNKDSVMELLRKTMPNQPNTLLSPALQQAYDLAKANKVQNGNNEILIITDGYFSISKPILEIIQNNPDIKLSFVLIEAGNSLVDIKKYIKSKFPKSDLVLLDSKSSDASQLLENIKKNSKKM